MSNALRMIALALMLASAGQAEKKYIIDECTPNDRRNVGDEISYLVTFRTADDARPSDTWLDGPSETVSSKSTTKPEKDRRTYTVKFTIPTTHPAGAAKLITTIDKVEARRCDVTIVQPSTPDRTPVNPFNPQEQVTISGSVKDATGAVVPGVQIEGKDVASGTTVTAMVDAAGQFTLSVPPGTYRVSAAMPGFGVQQKVITAIAGAKPTVDFIIQQ